MGLKTHRWTARCDDGNEGLPEEKMILIGSLWLTSCGGIFVETLLGEIQLLGSKKAVDGIARSLEDVKFQSRWIVFQSLSTTCCESYAQTNTLRYFQSGCPGALNHTRDDCFGQGDVVLIDLIQGLNRTFPFSSGYATESIKTKEMGLIRPKEVIYCATNAVHPSVNSFWDWYKTV